MNIFKSIGKVFESAAAPVLGFLTGGPMGAIQGYAAAGKAKTFERNMENANMFDYSNPLSGGSAPYRLPQVAAPASSSFFGNVGQTLGDFGRGVGQFVQDISPLAGLFGIETPMQQQAPPAATTVIRKAPDETASSGELLGANLGLGTGLVQAARGFARSPGGQALFGGGAGLAVGALSGGSNGSPRITRRMKSDVRKIYMMAGMNPNATAQILNNLGTYPRFNFDASLVFFILTKRFRNDGPVVTKAAVRKTKTTLRRMKGVVDMYNSVCKPTTRRTPARRAAPKAVQLIKN